MFGGGTMRVCREFVLLGGCLVCVGHRLMYAAQHEYDEEDQ
jgi:hypothetical protein